jgi:hypothetical protein
LHKPLHPYQNLEARSAQCLQYYCRRDQAEKERKETEENGFVQTKYLELGAIGKEFAYKEFLQE